MAEETPLFVWLDGKIVPWAEATLHVASEAVVRGESVFEGVRGYGNAEHNELYIFKNQEHSTVCANRPS
jgi:branched-chain amino acid aminotransferase